MDCERGVRTLACGFRPLISELRFWATRAWIDGFVLTGVGRLDGAEDVLAGTGAGIDVTSSAEVFEGGAIEVESFALRIRGEGAAAIGSFLPFEAEPAEVVEHGGDKLRPATRAIEVFVSEDQGAVLGASPFLRGPKGAGVAKVEEAGRRRGEAAPVGCWGCMGRFHGMSQ